jgi:predicted alpha/beta-fold hydrolase
MPLTSDLRGVTRVPQRRRCLFLVGFSLGGNVALKLAGNGRGARVRAGRLRVSAGSIWCLRPYAERDNRSTRGVSCAACGRLCAAGRYRKRDPACEEVIALDAVSPPLLWLRQRHNYYQTQSAIGYLGSLRVPALLIQAKDDTFVPFALYDRAIRSHPCVELVTRSMGAIWDSRTGPSPFWADRTIMEWIGDQY